MQYIENRIELPVDATGKVDVATMDLLNKIDNALKPHKLEFVVNVFGDKAFLDVSHQKSKRKGKKRKGVSLLA